jgi:type IV pilus assembly protein PilF
MASISRQLIRMVCVIFSAVFLMQISGCVTESANGGPDVLFPDKYNLAHAGDDYVALGYKYMEKGERESALKNIMKALVIDDNNPKALDALALFYQRDSEYDKAEQYFRKALSSDNSYTGGHLNYGQFLYSQKRYDEACKQFKTASEDTLYDQRASAFANLGTCYRALQQYEMAEAAFNDALRINSKNAAALIELADMFYEQQKYPSAMKNLDFYDQVAKPTAHSLLLGIKLQKIFGNADKEASLALQLKNLFPQSEEYLQYTNAH